MRALLFVVCLSACAGHPANTSGTSGGGTTGGGQPTGGSGRFGITGTTIGAAGGVQSALPALPELTNLAGAIIGDSVNVGFDPVDGAKDYRIYMLPKDADISTTSDGHISAKNAVYRCSGDRMAPSPTVDAVTQASSWIHTLVDNQNVGGYTRSLAEATLGYVYATAASDRIAVYALGDPTSTADNECYFGRWNESRVKKYTTDQTERAMLISQRWRDDGIAFYAPATGGVPVYTSLDTDMITRYYYVDGPEAQKRTGGTIAFNIQMSADNTTEPLMRVFYENTCGASHDELMGGNARFDRAYHQGDQPVANLHWSGVSADTTLVIEALDDKCPFPGMLAPAAADAFSGGGGDYPAWITLDDAQAASPTGEVSINGQGDGTNPKPIARSFIKVSPNTPSGFDWFEGFGAPLPAFSDNADCGQPMNNCWQEFRESSSELDASFIFTETTRHALSQQLGELWSAIADVGADVGGKFHLTANQQANLSADSFLYVTMETDTMTTGRRYPQILITDTAAPVYWTLPMGHAIVVQTFPWDTSSWPNQLAVEVCNERIWDVNQQCPAFHDLHENLDATDAMKITNLAPAPEVGEKSGLDRSVLWEVYASSKRVYLFFDGKPQGCADLPTDGVPSGAVSVTFGHVLYHSGVDSMVGLSDFIAAHGQTESHHHYDNLGFKSGVSAPMWDEDLLPCARAAQMNKGE